MRAWRSKPSLFAEKNSYRPNARNGFDILEDKTGSTEFENLIFFEPSGRLRDLASLDTGGANLLALSASLGQLHTYGLQVGIETAARAIVRV